MEEKKVPMAILKKMTGLGVLTDREIRWIETVIKEHAMCRITISYGITSPDHEGNLYVLSVNTTTEGIDVMLDMPGVAVMRSVGIDSSLREIVQGIKSVPFDDLLKGRAEGYVSLALNPPLERIRRTWIREVAELIDQQQLANVH